MDTSTKIIQKEDYRLFVPKPDPSFSPARNKAIINETIQETEKYFRDLSKPDDEMLERINIFSTYASYRFNKGQKSVRDYLGKELHSRMIGENILSKIKVMEASDRLSGRGRFIQL